MEPFTLLYLFYCAKLICQTSTCVIWLADPSSRTIAYLADFIVLLSAAPLFHVIVHMLLSKPLSYASLIAYICLSLLLAFLWFEPTRDTRQHTKSILPFGLVTTCDLLVVLIFILQKTVLRELVDRCRGNKRKRVKKSEPTDVEARPRRGDNEAVLVSPVTVPRETLAGAFPRSAPEGTGSNRASVEDNRLNGGRQEFGRVSQVISDMDNRNEATGAENVEGQYREVDPARDSLLPRPTGRLAAFDPHTAHPLSPRQFQASLPFQSEEEGRI